MPRFLKHFSMTLVTSLSRPGRIFGSASRIVTLVPRSASIDANSQPITPPPMMAARFGSSLIERNSSEVITILPSTSKPGQRAGHRARRQHDGVAGELEVARAAARHGDPLAGVQPAVAVEHGDLAALEQRAEPGDEPVDDLVLAGRARRDQSIDASPALMPYSDGLVHVEVGGRRLEQLLGRDAPDVEAGAAEPALLDHGDVQPRRRAVERRGVAAGTAADDDDVVVLSRGDHLRVVRVRARSDFGLYRSDRRPRLGRRACPGHCCCWAWRLAGRPAAWRRISTTASVLGRPPPE